LGVFALYPRFFRKKILGWASHIPKGCRGVSQRPFSSPQARPLGRKERPWLYSSFVITLRRSTSGACAPYHDEPLRMPPKRLAKRSDAVAPTSSPCELEFVSHSSSFHDPSSNGARPRKSQAGFGFGTRLVSNENWVSVRICGSRWRDRHKNVLMSSC